jgi:hypothetical protein
MLLQLAVPYLSQNDSATGQGARMCFSSSCAMAAAYLKPDALQGSGQIDDRYLAMVQRYGDTTNPAAQVSALGSLGIEARFRTDGTLNDLISQLERRIPCPVGWLHHGPVSSPSGGGHWSLVIGWDASKRDLLMHDPNGEADLLRGGYLNRSNGAGLRYSAENFLPRWLVDGAGSGWWIGL